MSHHDDPTIEPLVPFGYEPDWIVDVSEGCVVGLTIDDGCFVALTRDEWGYWIPTTHLLVEVAARLGELADTIATDRYRRGGSSAGDPPLP